MLSHTIILLLLVVLICMIVYYYYYSNSKIKEAMHLIPEKEKKTVRFNESLNKVELFSTNRNSSKRAKHVNNILEELTNEMNSMSSDTPSTSNNRWDIAFDTPFTNNNEEQEFLSKIKKKHQKYLHSGKKYDEYNKDRDGQVIMPDEDFNIKMDDPSLRGKKISDAYNESVRGPIFKNRKLKKMTQGNIVYEEDSDEDEIKAYSGSNYHSAIIEDEFH